MQENPRVRLKHQLEIIYAGRTPVAIHSGRPAGIVAEAIENGRILELAGYAELRRDTHGHRNCRIDFAVKGNALRTCYMKIENVTLADEGTAYFPDFAVKSGAQMMSELTDLVREGNRVLFFFLAQRADVERFRLADHIDPEFCQVFRDAVARGVETVCYRAKVTRKGIELDRKLEINLAEA